MHIALDFDEVIAIDGWVFRPKIVVKTDDVGS